MLRTFAITTHIGCRNMCNYCPQNKVIKAYTGKNKIKVMSFDIFKKCIDKLPIGTNINFAGFVEPCLNPEYIKMILYANKLGIKIQLLTTIVGMTIHDIDLIENIPFIRFLVHLPDNEKQTKIRVNKQFIQVVKRLITSKINVEWKFHRSPLGNEDVHPLLKIIFTEANLYDEIIETELKTRAGNIEIEGKSFVTKITGNISGCHLLYVNQLLPNGDVVICCMDWQLKYVLGNLLESDYESLFQGKVYKNILNGFTDDNSEILCRYCELCQQI